MPEIGRNLELSTNLDARSTKGETVPEIEIEGGWEPKAGCMTAATQIEARDRALKDRLGLFYDALGRGGMSTSRGCE